MRQTEHARVRATCIGGRRSAAGRECALRAAGLRRAVASQEPSFLLYLPAFVLTSLLQSRFQSRASFFLEALPRSCVLAVTL